jgi:hypothetical protein
MNQTPVVKSQAEEPRSVSFKGLIPRRIQDPLLDAPIRITPQPILI